MISPLKVGSKAPAFQAPVVGGSYEVGQKLKLSDLKGEHVVLYFYPKDDTPGCTKQACALRDGWQQISKKARVFGVSIDSVKSHEKFIKKPSLQRWCGAEMDRRAATDPRKSATRKADVQRGGKLGREGSVLNIVRCYAKTLSELSDIYRSHQCRSH